MRLSPQAIRLAETDRSSREAAAKRPVKPLLVIISLPSHRRDRIPFFDDSYDITTAASPSMVAFLPPSLMSCPEASHASDLPPQNKNSLRSNSRALAITSPRRILFGLFSSYHEITVRNLNLLTAYDRINRIYKITVRTKSCHRWRRLCRKKDNPQIT